MLLDHWKINKKNRLKCLKKNVENFSASRIQRTNFIFQVSKRTKFFRRGNFSRYRSIFPNSSRRNKYPEFDKALNFLKNLSGVEITLRLVDWQKSRLNLNYYIIAYYPAVVSTNMCRDWTVFNCRARRKYMPRSQWAGKYKIAERFL